MFIQTETTPNPDAIKFLPSRSVMTGGTLDARTPNEAAASPLAQRLFAVDGVAGVFLSPTFIAVTKAAAADWGIVKPRVQSTIMDFFMSGAAAVTPDEANANTVTSDDPIVQKILVVIDEKIRPGVARDGGDVRFVAFDEGVLYLEMRGACAGCPAMGVTLKSGIEKIMRADVPEVAEVMAVS